MPNYLTKALSVEPDCILLARDYNNPSVNKSLAKQIERDGYTVVYAPNTDCEEQAAEAWNNFLAKVYSVALLNLSFKYNTLGPTSREHYKRIARDVTLINSVISGIDADLVDLAQSIGHFCCMQLNPSEWEKHSKFFLDTKTEFESKIYTEVNEELTKLPKALYPLCYNHAYKFFSDFVYKSVLNVVTPTGDSKERLRLSLGRNGMLSFVRISSKDPSKYETFVGLGDKLSNDIRQIAYGCARDKDLECNGVKIDTEQTRAALFEIKNYFSQTTGRAQRLSDYYTYAFDSIVNLVTVVDDIYLKHSTDVAFTLVKYMKMNYGRIRTN